MDNVVAFRGGTQGDTVRWSKPQDLRSWTGPVRMATKEDEDRLVNMLIAFHREGGLDIATCSPKKIREEVQVATQNQGAIAGVIDAPDGRIAASVGIFPLVPWYTDELVLQEQWFYVRAEFRGQGMEKRLFDFAGAYRAEMSARMGRKIKCYVGIIDKRRLAAKIRLFSRRARQMGALFVMED